MLSCQGLGRRACLVLVALVVAAGYGCAHTGLNTAERAGVGYETPAADDAELLGQDDVTPSDSGTVPETATLLARRVVQDAEYLATSPLRIDKKGALILGGVAAGIGGLMVADEDIEEFWDRNRTATGKDVFDGVTELGSAKVVYPVHAGLLGAGYWFREHEAGEKLMQTSLVSLEALAFTETLVALTKVAVGRRRPNDDRGSDSYDPFSNTDRSFPSGHTARAFAFAAVFADRYEQPVPFVAYLTATAVGASRMYLDKHWGSDVFAGAALGITLGKVLSWRHPFHARGLAFLPYVPGVHNSLGLTARYSF